MKKIVILGGSGYVGSAIISFFLDKKIRVINLDNLIYNQKNKFSFSKDKNYQFIKYDLRDKNLDSSILKDADTVVILASLVGDPISNKYKKITKSINITATKKFIEKSIKQNVKKLIFVSTCSNYGLIENNVPAKENYKLNPLSPYAKSKVSIENFLINKKSKSLDTKIFILRFATAFGFSERMRFDLTVNEFIKTIMQRKKLLIYDENTWRPYCHVKDFARLIYIISNSIKKSKFEILNVGENKNNATKLTILNKILKYLPYKNIEFKKIGKDKRNYIVNFNKVKKMYNFNCSMNIDKGIKEIITNIKKDKKFFLDEKNKSKFGNYLIKKDKLRL
jgi:nucleoside-diphosphate-sugar epimerase